MIQIFIFILTLLAYTLSAFPQENDGVITNRKTVVTANKKAIKVAVVLPITGEFREVGIDLARSLSVIRDLTQDPKYDREFGGAYTFDIRVKNGACNAEQARKVAQNIIAEKDIMFVIGHYCSVASLAAAPLYSDAGIIQITPFSTQSILTEQGYKTFFRMAGRTDRYGEVAAEWLSELKQDNKLATIYGDDIYGKSLVDNVILGLDLRDSVLNDKKPKDFKYYYQKPIIFDTYRDNITAMINKLVKDSIKLVYFGGYYSDLILILKEVKRRNLKINFFTGSSAQNYEFWKQSNDTAEGTIFTFTRDYTRDISGEERNKAKRALNFNKYKKVHGIEKAIRKYGIQASRSIFESNKSYKDRVLFIKEYYKQYNKFPDAYMTSIYATFEIMKNIIVNPDFKEPLNEIRNANLSETDFRQFGYEIAAYMKDKGYNTSEEKVGFSTILGAVNFSLTGEWSNIEYVIYQWVKQRQNRQWLTATEDEEYIGPEGDFMRLF